MVGPSKHSAKQKAFVAVLAWSVILLPRPGKAPGSSGGLFQALIKAGGEGLGGAYFLSPINPLTCYGNKRVDMRGPHRRRATQQDLAGSPRAWIRMFRPIAG